MSDKAKQRFAADRQNRCAVTRHEFLPLPLQIAHIIPRALARTRHPQHSPFWALVRLLHPARSGVIWQLAGGANSNSAANLLLLSPDFHALLDNGEFFLLPIPDHSADFAAVRYEVAFASPPRPLRYTTVVDGVCVELREGHAVPVVLGGNGMLHSLMNKLRGLAWEYDFSPRERGREQDLGVCCRH
jgi:hypothetical protein